MYSHKSFRRGKLYSTTEYNSRRHIVGCPYYRKWKIPWYTCSKMVLYGTILLNNSLKSQMPNSRATLPWKMRWCIFSQVILYGKILRNNQVKFQAPYSRATPPLIMPWDIFLTVMKMENTLAHILNENSVLYDLAEQLDKMSNAIYRVAKTHKIS